MQFSQIQPLKILKHIERKTGGGGGGIDGDGKYGRRKNTKGKMRRQGEGRNKEPQRHNDKGRRKTE
jgi:hypothetical protein